MGFYKLTQVNISPFKSLFCHKTFELHKYPKDPVVEWEAYSNDNNVITLGSWKGSHRFRIVLYYHNKTSWVTGSLFGSFVTIIYANYIDLGDSTIVIIHKDYMQKVCDNKN